MRKGMKKTLSTWGKLHLAVFGTVILMTVLVLVQGGVDALPDTVHLLVFFVAMYALIVAGLKVVAPESEKD